MSGGITLAVLCEPPATGAFGNAESPILTVTCSIGMPSVSDATCASTVYMPVPRSCVAHLDDHAAGLFDANAYPGRTGHARIRRRRHAEADQLVALAHRARCGRAAIPTETVRTLSITFEQMFARPGQTARWIAIGVIAHAHFQRIDAGGDGEFVERALERKRARCFARRAHRGRRCDIEHDVPMARTQIRHVVEHLRNHRARLGPVAGGGCRIEHVVRERGEFAVGADPRANPLFGRRPMAVRGEELTAIDHELDGATGMFGRHRRNHGVRPRPAFRTEAATEKRAHDPHVFRIDAEHVGERRLRPVDPLRGIMHGQFVARPPGNGCGRLHRIVRVGRRGVRRVDVRGRFSKPALRSRRARRSAAFP